jgi:hypothetical protein
MAMLSVTAVVGDLSSLTHEKEFKGHFHFNVYVSVTDADGRPVDGLTKKDFSLTKLGGVAPAELDSADEIKVSKRGKVVTARGFYRLDVDRAIPKNEAIQPQAHVLGLTVHRSGDHGQTIFKVSYPNV